MKISNEFKRFVKFGIVGVINTLLNWIIFFMLNSVGIYYIISNVIAYSIATINSYFWNSKWVFKYEKDKKAIVFLKFILLNLFGLTLNTIILFVLVDKFMLDKILALVITTGIVMFINYIINKLCVFKK